MRLLARDISIPSRLTVFRLAAALGLAAAFVPVHAAAAQDPYPDLDDIGLVMNVHTESVAPNVSESAEPLVGAMYKPMSVLMYFTEAIAGGKAAKDLQSVFIELSKDPSPSSRDLVIRVKDERMRVDMGTSSLLARLDEDGSVLEWGVLDPVSGRVVDSDLFDIAVREQSSAPYEAIGSDNVSLLGDRAPIRTDEFAQIAGHTARRYDFSQKVVITPLGTDGNVWPIISMDRSSRVWIAEKGPYVNDPDASAVSREFTRTMPPELVQLTAGGLLLGADDESNITVAMAGGASTAGGGALEASSSFRVTHLSREVVDDALLAGFEQDEQACDCGCTAFAQLKTLSESDPNALGKAMCAQQCMPKWMSSCIDMSGGD